MGGFKGLGAGLYGGSKGMEGSVRGVWGHVKP